jgi:histidyl-tRNA synthetase
MKEGKAGILSVNSPRGTADICGEDIKYRDFIITTVRELFEIFNFEEIITPAFEHTEVFSRSIGESTDIVQKEMYTFPDRKGRSLTLRPEGTAPVVRSVVEKKMLVPGKIPLKLFYIGNMFRYERPQKGRMREFWQLGVEAMGSSSTLLDAEIIWLLNEIFKRLGFKNLVLKINTIGCSKCRKDYLKIFKQYIEPELDNLCPDCQRRFKVNPLRIFDCRIEGCKKIVSAGPKIKDYLCENCRKLFEELKSIISDLSIDYTISDDLVRGFDYYTGIIFEMASNDIDSAQNALGGGGRYDNLIAEFSGPDMPAVGFAVGLDRTVLLMRQLGIKYMNVKNKPKSYIISLSEEVRPYAIDVLKQLRSSDIACDIDYSSGSLGSSLKNAVKKGFNTALIIGEEEVRGNIITIKDLKNFKQYKVKKDNLVKEVLKITGEYKNE